MLKARIYARVVHLWQINLNAYFSLTLVYQFTLETPKTLEGKEKKYARSQVSHDLAQFHMELANVYSKSQPSR